MQAVRGSAIVLFLLGLGAGCVGPAGQAPAASGLDGLLDHLASIRGEGGFPVGLAPYIAEAAWAADFDPAAWPPEHPVLQDVRVPEGSTFLQSLRPMYALALADAPGAPERGAHLLAGFDGEQFGDPGLLNDDAFAILALAADGEPQGSPALQASAAFLLRHRNGAQWSYAVGGRGGVDMTGMVLSALAAAGRLDAVPTQTVVEGLREARATQGYGGSAGDEANCDSTVWALRSLALLGEPMDEEAQLYLRFLQRPDGGVAYVHGEESNWLCSVEVATLWGLQQTGRLPRA